MGTDLYLVNHEKRRVLAIGKALWLPGDEVNLVLTADEARESATPEARQRYGTEPDRVIAWLEEHGSAVLRTEEADDPWRGESDDPNAFDVAAPGWVVERLDGERWTEGRERAPEPQEVKCGPAPLFRPAIVQALGEGWTFWPGPQLTTLVLHRSGLHLVVSSPSLGEIPGDAARAIAAELHAAIGRGVTGRVGVSMRKLGGVWLVSVDAQP